MNKKGIRNWNFVIDMKEILEGKNSVLENTDMDTFLEDTRRRVENIYNKKEIKDKKKRKDAIWWDQKLESERKKVRALRRRYQIETDTDKRNELCNIFRKARAKYKKNILIRKRNSFKEFINNITISGMFRTAYKIIKEKKKSNNIDNKLTRDDGTMTDSLKKGGN